ncbi:MAG: carbon monoxide dehydrogenase, partial [Gammaproteobacteria bacterium]|nr:carbon monoxide dehydrogenase [Gammaproteobacteria bacterium]
SASALDGVAIDSSDLIGDIHAAPDYRAHLVREMAKRAVDAC